MLRLFHSADWHLGHSLHGVSRDYEHARFLAWLGEQLEQRHADALIVCGDLFDSANPPASAQSLLYRFLVDARRRRPDLDVVLIGGNHDSPARLQAPAPLLRNLGVHMVGGLPKSADGEPDWEALLVPLRDANGETAAWCGAMPYLRSADLPPPVDAVEDPLIDGVERRYAGLIQSLRERHRAGQGMLVTGHCYLAGTQLSELSERRILGGNQHALPSAIFPGDLDYVALGHLHRAQQVKGSTQIRYSGSPIPLALDEAGYRHQVLQVDLEPGRPPEVEALPVPRSVDILRLPKAGPAPLEALAPELEQLALDPGLPPECHPYLELRVLLERPEPGLRQRIEELLAGRPLRLLKLATSYAGSGAGLGDQLPEQSLQELDPEQVFRSCWERSHEGEPPAELLTRFRQLVEAVQEAD